VTASPHVLWIDDELSTRREDHLSPWLRWLQRQQKKQRLRLTCCHDLAEFASQLQASADARGTGGPDAVDILIIDVMLKREEQETFAMLGYPEERLLLQDAGVQIVALLRNAEHAALRPAWLAAHGHTPVVLLSSSKLVDEAIASHVNRKFRVDLYAVSKSIEQDADDGEMTASNEFIRRMEQLLLGRLTP
jgi:hypothetical protein